MHRVIGGLPVYILFATTSSYESSAWLAIGKKQKTTFYVRLCTNRTHNAPLSLAFANSLAGYTKLHGRVPFIASRTPSYSLYFNIRTFKIHLNYFLFESSSFEQCLILWSIKSNPSDPWETGMDSNIRTLLQPRTIRYALRFHICLFIFRYTSTVYLALSFLLFLLLLFFLFFFLNSLALHFNYTRDTTEISRVWHAVADS